MTIKRKCKDGFAGDWEHRQPDSAEKFSFLSQLGLVVVTVTRCRLLLSTCACVEYYGRALETLIKKVTVHCIHGKMKNKRNKIFADFRTLKR